ncbi:MAG: peroxiredoxin [Arenicella sp.]|jgi:peroxiredoxin
MAAVHSTMQPLGTAAPEFCLPDTRQNSSSVSLSDLQSKPLLVMFICNHCPYVIHVVERMAEIANAAVDQGFAVVAISSNDVDYYPQDGPAEMADFAAQYRFDFPYLYDQSQAVAKAFNAACTPDFFVYDADHKLKYRGQMDASRPASSQAVNGAELSTAINAVIDGRALNQTQTPSIGCNIKWKAGNEPDYY